MENRKYTKKQVKCFNIQTGEVKIYDSVVESMRATGVHQVSITLNCNKKQRQAGGYYFTYDLSETVIPELTRAPRNSGKALNPGKVNKPKKEHVPKEEARKKYELKNLNIDNKILAKNAVAIIPDPETGRRTIYIKSTVDQWSHLEMEYRAMLEKWAKKDAKEEKQDEDEFEEWFVNLEDDEPID
jgi:hypothetical protein